MNTHILASIYDNKSEIFFAPQLFRSTADFVRTIQNEAKRSDSMLNKHPSDYELYVISNWSESTAEQELVHKRLGSVLDLCPLE